MSSDVHVDICGNGQGGVDAAFDPATGGLDVAEMAQPRFGDVLESLVDTENLAIADYYYPDVNGFGMLGFNNALSLSGKLIADAATTVTLTVEATNDEAITDWIPVTEIFRKNDNTVSNASIVCNNATVLYGLDLDHPPYQRFRLKINIAGGAVNTVTCKMLRKAQ